MAIPLVQSEAIAARRRIPIVLELAAARNAVQRIDLGTIADTDTFEIHSAADDTGTLTFNGTNFPSGDGSSYLQTAIQALSDIGASNATVAKVTGEQAYDVTFVAGLAATDVALLSVENESGFTPGDPAVVELTHGGPAGYPARTLDLDENGDPGEWAEGELVISKAGGAFANVADITKMVAVDHGVWYYEASQTELNTIGSVVLVTLRSDVRTRFGLAAVQGSSTALGAPVIRSGTAQSGGLNHIILDASASSVNNFYKNKLVYMREGTGAGQAAYCWAYNGSTKRADLEPTLVVAVDSTTVFDILPIPPVAWEMFRANHVLADTFGGDLSTPEEIADAVAGQTEIADTITLVADIEDATEHLTFDGNDNVNATLAGFGTDAITADSISAGAVTKIQTGLALAADAFDPETDEVDANIVKVNDVTIGGAGTGGDPFGPA